LDFFLHSGKYYSLDIFTIQNDPVIQNGMDFALFNDENYD